VLFILLMSTWLIVAVGAAVGALRTGRIELSGRVADRAGQPLRFWCGVLGALAFATLMLALLARMVSDAIARTGLFADIGFFDLAAQWLAAIPLAFILGPSAWYAVRDRIDAARRRRLRTEIETLADDLRLPPDDIDFDDIIELYEVAKVVALRDELRRMPAGSRVLRVALDAVDPLAADATQGAEATRSVVESAAGGRRHDGS
jgi:hypothetical protein